MTSCRRSYDSNSSAGVSDLAVQMRRPSSVTVNSSDSATGGIAFDGKSTDGVPSKAPKVGWFSRFGQASSPGMAPGESRNLTADGSSSGEVKLMFNSTMRKNLSVVSSVSSDTGRYGSLNVRRNVGTAGDAVGEERPGKAASPLPSNMNVTKDNSTLLSPDKTVTDQVWDRVRGNTNRSAAVSYTHLTLPTIYSV